MPVWQLIWTERALKDAGRMDPRERERIFNALERFAASGHGDVKLLHGHRGEWRLRVGDWRVRYTFDTPTQSLRVLHVLPRGRAYRD